MDKTTNVCRKCNSEIASDSKFCPQCGTKAPLKKVKQYSIMRLIVYGFFAFIAYQVYTSYQGYTEKASKVPAEEVTVVAKQAVATPTPTEKPKSTVATPTASAPTADLSSARIRVANIFKSPKEPTAKDAIWAADNIFKVGVINDGSNRSGYANYVCETLYEHGFRGQRIAVQIIDITKLVNTKEWVELGIAFCK